jgi:NAD+ kinase
VPDASAGALFADVDLAIVFGGDGSVVSAGRAAARHGVPVIGVNYGTFGFLTEIAASELDAGLAAVCDGAYEVEDRLMLAGRLDGGDEELPAANDIAIKPSESGRMLDMRVRLGDDLIAEIPADGLVLATPTGSTAYNLSAGGPVLAPSVPALVMTPICPHTLGTRPLVLDADAELTVELLDVPRMSHVAVVSWDGQVHREMRLGQMLAVRRADSCLRLARLHRGAFFRSLRDKLGWGLPK